MRLLVPDAMRSGIYNVCRDGRVSTKRFARGAGWYPER
jgi:hypothetical protein